MPGNKVVRDFIEIPNDYRFDLNLEFLTRSAKEILHVVEDGHVFKAVSAENGPVIFRLTPLEKNIEIGYLKTAPRKSERQTVIDYVREWLDLQTDLTPFYAMAAKDPLLKAPAKKFRGYRIVGMPDLFEALCWAIIGQQINLGFAYTLKQRFVEKFGEYIDYNGKKLYLFPRPEVVATLRDEQLLPLQFSRQKSKYVQLIAEAFRDNVISKEYIRSLPFHEARQKLMAIKGVGNWTANYALMKTFRYPEAFPLEDAGLHNAIKHLKKLPQKPTLEQVKRIFNKYKGWEAYATLYLWKTL
jgi:DNA-3-methyladenine glycosylase II